MKRKLVAALGAGALVTAGLLVIWWQARPAAGELSELSRAEFGRIEKATRQAMWRKAVGNGSSRTVLASPTSLWRLATSRISQIELLPIAGHVEVKTRSRSGDYFYYLVNRNLTGESDWHVLGEGPSRQAHFISLNPLGTVNIVKVDGGLGLIGGRLSPGGDGGELEELLRNAPRSKSYEGTNGPDHGANSSFFEPVSLGYDKQPSSAGSAPRP